MLTGMVTGRRRAIELRWPPLIGGGRIGAAVRGLGSTLAGGNNWLRLPVDSKSNRLLGRLQIAPVAVHVVGEPDHLNAPPTRRHHLDGKDHERPQAHHAVRGQ